MPVKFIKPTQLCYIICTHPVAHRLVHLVTVVATTYACVNLIMILSFYSFYTYTLQWILRLGVKTIIMDMTDINCTTLINLDCVCHKGVDVACFSEDPTTTGSHLPSLWMTRRVVSILNYLHRYRCLLFIIKQAYANLLTKINQIYNLTSSKGSSNLV